ncbi:FAD-dependent oxidoreductase [Candidatus Berkiella aquae]|uniref:D-amino-acid oxidase n=1 Tax=Candidatus Berkiella aquae TaxID=295108 RepID=A0A0Q9YN78_9GAMM|nr:FAD-dependent oxidoreductase [Candidatus Berkiella aquae]MCS5709930.1 FAD-binding oxidoreductase [Candidatus Berkiella aquae]
MKKLLTGFTLGLSLCLMQSAGYAQQASSNIEVRKMNPPNLSDAHLGKKILCYRPKYQEAPRLSIETTENKIIAHHYGHGGAGWSLGPGSAKQLVELLKGSEQAKSLTKETPITIIGAGVIGLYTAYMLEQQGYKHITVVAEKFNQMPSYYAGGTFSPEVRMKDRQQKTQKYNMAIESLRFYRSIAHQQHPIFKTGARTLPAYFQDTTESTLEPFVGDGILPHKPVVLDFGNGKTQSMVVYDDGLFIDVEGMMHQLTRYLKKNKVKFVKKKITAFSEIKDNVIINCSGLGARELVSDNEVIPAQGHLIMLKNQNPKDLEQLMVYLFEANAVNERGQKVIRVFYLFPKRSPKSAKNDVGVLGGTYVLGATPETPNEEEFDILVKNAKTFYGIKE